MHALLVWLTVTTNVQKFSFISVKWLWVCWKQNWIFLFLIWQHKHLFICLQTSLSLVVCLSFSIFSSFSFCSFIIRSFSLACWADSASALAWLRPTAWWKTLCSCSSCPRRCLLWSGNRSWACSEINTWILNATLLTSLDRAAREFCNFCGKKNEWLWKRCITVTTIFFCFKSFYRHYKISLSKKAEK